MKVFYQCNRIQPCNNSPICGSQCTHTTDKKFSYIRPERTYRILENGDFWEETPELASRVKDSGRRMLYAQKEDASVED